MAVFHPSRKKHIYQDSSLGSFRSPSEVASSPFSDSQLWSWDWEVGSVASHEEATPAPRTALVLQMLSKVPGNPNPLKALLEV